MGRSVEEKPVSLADNVHPDAPRASSGQGSGRVPHPIDKSEVAFADAPRMRLADPLQQGAKNNPPPATKPSTKNVNGVVVTIVADTRESAGSGAFTEGKWAPVGSLTWDNAPDNKIKNVKAPKAGLTIKTIYYGSSKATDKSAYGRGTTATDVANRDVTLGFHESCHRQDYLDYCANNAVPVFDSSVTTKEDAAKELDRWSKAATEYFRKMRAASDKKTDEVGNPTKSDYLQKP